MKTTVYSTHKFDRPSLEKANGEKHDIQWLDIRLTEEIAILAQGSQAVCLFAGDDASAPVLEKLKECGIKYIALRSAGFNHGPTESQRTGHTSGACTRLLALCHCRARNCPYFGS